MFLGTLLWSVHLCSTQSLLLSTRGGCSEGASFSRRIQVHSKWPRNTITCNHDWWEGMWGRSNLTQKKFNSLFWSKVWTPQSKTPWSTPIYYKLLQLAPRVFTRTTWPKVLLPHNLCINMITSESKSLSMNAPPNMAAMTSDLAFKITLCP